MFEISLKNDKKFLCDAETTIFDAAKSNGIVLEHSCLNARCRSCAVKVVSGDTINVEDELVLSSEEKEEGYILSCNAKPKSDLELDIEDLGDITLFDKKIVPAKINHIDFVTDDVIKLTLRLPPNANFKFVSGQYINIIKGNLSRSYSVANCAKVINQLEFYIKKYKDGKMSHYLFNEAKVNDLLRVEGPLGSFFLRESNKKTIIFLATGTGVAPVKAILDDLNYSKNSQSINRDYWVFVGARHQQDLFWLPKYENININYIPTLSRPNENWKGERGYVQDIVLKKDINLHDTQVYACGSNQMIESAKKLLTANALDKNEFYSDAFVQTN